MANIIFIDNFDSFSYNLVDEFKILGNAVEVYRNNVLLNTLL
ncbi:MAG: anthranilate synthase component 2, partial [Francisella sp.]